MVGLVSKLVKLFNGVTKNQTLNEAIKDSTGVIDLTGKLAQIALDSLEEKSR
nr:hypothetical protein [uncultured Sphaerochaeta sp.]